MAGCLGRVVMDDRLLITAVKDRFLGSKFQNLARLSTLTLSYSFAAIRNAAAVATPSLPCPKL